MRPLRSTRYYAIRFVVGLCLVTLTAADARADECYPLASGAAADITVSGDCHHVYNGSGLELCVTTYYYNEWTSFYNSPPASATVSACAPQTCNLPWGGTINNGDSVTAYSRTSGTDCNGGCPSETRTCSNGSLGGSYQYSSCSSSGCGGMCDGGYCYYMSGGSCDSACTDIGLTCDLAATNRLDYVSGGLQTCYNLIVAYWGYDNGPGGQCGQNNNDPQGPFPGNGYGDVGCFLDYNYDCDWYDDGQNAYYQYYYLDAMERNSTCAASLVYQGWRMCGCH